ncbi:hypothetical protein [Streptomyces sp. SP18CS02]|uniref:hypothetical protein n=1 Tax=Streptomyces sp. SP18CS02 TaxID=3002531 RepID=UPI002E77B095|nr:hypothetical protein [Streptomyces sp. SP18CS02]MEE1751972.1 hypothetical protein [Streptomyces sp. SP18CS02]
MIAGPGPAAEPDIEPNTDRPDPSVGPGAGPHTSLREGHQRVDSGVALMGNVGGDFTYLNISAWNDEATERILKPRLREGPYPAEEVRGRLYGFVEPPSYARCRKALDSRIVLLRARAGTGVGTAAFALLVERHGEGGVTGLDAMADLSAWRPKAGRGYLLQGLPAASARSLDDVRLAGLAEALRGAGAHLVVTMAQDARLPSDTGRWEEAHAAPGPHEVAERRLRLAAAEGRLDSSQLDAALGHLASPEFTDYLSTHSLPGDAVDLSDGLRQSAETSASTGSVLEDLLTGTEAAARSALAQARHSADKVSLMAAVALLPGQDRTVIEQFATAMRPLLGARAAKTGQDGAPEDQSPDVLGPSFEDRLEAIGARPLAPRSSPADRYRYPVQPVVFSGRHRSATLLRHLWLDFEGMPEALWGALEQLRYQPGLDVAAGEAIGRVLAHATGPGALTQLHRFASSGDRWRRRLVAVALGEIVQHPLVSGAVKEQMRRWSRSSAVLRCTVAETCAGSYGLARPAAALKLLDAVLDGSSPELDARLRSAVSFALGALLTEEENHIEVLDTVTRWLEAGRGTPRHTLAVHVIHSMCLSTFPQPGAPGAVRVSLAGTLERHPAQGFALVVLGLDDPATYEAVAQVLGRIEADPDMFQRAALDHVLSELSRTARHRRGVIRFLLGRHRDHTNVSRRRNVS